MKIIHLSVMRELTRGIEAQLRAESSAANDLKGTTWRTIAIHDNRRGTSFSIRPPFCFRGMFVRNLFGWLFALKMSRQVDYLLLRHIPFDPFALIFSPIIRNRISIHHSKEIDELKLIAPGWKGKAASILERITGRIALRNAVAVAGVTREIAEFQCKLHGVRKPIIVYPNGVDPQSVSILRDKRESSEVTHMFFICSRFSSWQGLDRLISAANAHYSTKALREFRIHLVGRLSEAQRKEIESFNRHRNVFEVHGVLGQAEYRERIMSLCDIGIASLAVDRKNLREASTLKVRDMLSSGLPVYSTHEDAALDDDFPFYFKDDRVSISRMLDFADLMKKYTREHVSTASLEALSKLRSMERLIAELQAIQAERHS